MTCAGSFGRRRATSCAGRPQATVRPPTSAAAVAHGGRKSKRRTFNRGCQLPRLRQTDRAHRWGTTTILEPGKATRSVFGARRTVAVPESTTALECAAQKGKSCRASTLRPSSNNQAVQSETQRTRRSLRAGRESSCSTMPPYARATDAKQPARVLRGRNGSTTRQTSSIGNAAHAAFPGGIGASPRPGAGTACRGSHLTPQRVGTSEQSARANASERACKHGSCARPQPVVGAVPGIQSSRRPSSPAASTPPPTAASISTIATSSTAAQPGRSSIAGPTVSPPSVEARNCHRQSWPDEFPTYK
mmetsp:Transcript_6535/g.17676  ORF Transcript_6535/g.17676 Transcript_6535/m.17676 type:complete len:304 (+) Transcript_6535:466-1377(+)